MINGEMIKEHNAPSSVLDDAVRSELIAPRDPFSVEGSVVGEQVAAQGAAELVMDQFLAPRASALVMA